MEWVVLGVYVCCHHITGIVPRFVNCDALTWYEICVLMSVYPCHFAVVFGYPLVMFYACLDISWFCDNLHDHHNWKQWIQNGCIFLWTNNGSWEEDGHPTAASSGKWPGPAATRLHAHGRVVVIRGPRPRPRDLSASRCVVCTGHRWMDTRKTGATVAGRHLTASRHDTDRRESCPGAIARLHCRLLTSHRQVAGAPHESTRPSTLQLYPSGERAVPAAATGSLFRSRGSELFDVHMTCTNAPN